MSNILAYIHESAILKNTSGIVDISGPLKTQEWDNLYVTKWQLTHKGIQAIIFLLFQQKQEGGYYGHEHIVIRTAGLFNCDPPTYSHQGPQPLTKSYLLASG
jgi:hypothetical protein